jgi:hypothetical protein
MSPAASARPWPRSGPARHGPELVGGSVAAIGIVKGTPVTPDELTERIATEAVEVVEGASTYLGPRQPYGVKPGNWIQAMPGKGRHAIFRPPQPARTLLR